MRCVAVRNINWNPAYSEFHRAFDSLLAGGYNPVRKSQTREG